MASDVDNYVDENMVTYLMQLSNKLKTIEPTLVPIDPQFRFKFKKKIDEVIKEIKSKID